MMRRKIQTAIPALILIAAAILGAALAGEPRSILVFSILPALLWAAAFFGRTFDYKNRQAWSWLVLLAGLYFLRMIALPISFGDYKGFLLPWFERIQEQTFSESMQHPATNYMVLYEYFIFLISRTRYVPLELYKLFSICFEALLGWACAELAGMVTEDAGTVHARAFLLALALPTVYLNSALWAQCDGIYAALALAGLVFFLQDRLVGGSLLFAMSFCFKLQSIFLFPILLCLLLQKRVKIWHLLSIAGWTLLFCIPALLGGRTPQQLLGIYLGQMGEHSTELVLKAPTVFQFVSGKSQWDLTQLGTLGIAAAFLCAGLVNLLSLHTRGNRGIILGVMALSLCIPYLLPHMHERYFYLAEVLSIVFLFACREGGIAALLLQICVLKGYLEALFETETVIPWSLVSILVGMLCILVLRRLFLEGENHALD